MRRISGQRDFDGQLKRLGDAVRHRRIERGLSQEALAEASGIDRSHMGKIERGERNVTILNISRIARSLGLKLSDLMIAADL